MTVLQKLKFLSFYVADFQCLFLLLCYIVFYVIALFCWYLQNFICKRNTVTLIKKENFSLQMYYKLHYI